MTKPLSILLLADDQRGAPSTIHDHIQAFARFSRHRVHMLNPRNLARSRSLDLAEFDVVVIHYSIVVIWDDYFSPWFREQVTAFDGLKVQFLQDEYRWVNEIASMIRSMGIDVLYSVVPADNVESVYGRRLPDTEILCTLTGYVPDSLVDRATPPLAKRPIDVGYRGRSLPYWLGPLGHEKIEIGRGFLSRSDALGLRTDIAWSENARIYGTRWYEWMAACRTMLASESGSSIVDWDGAAERAVRAYLSEAPTASYEEAEDRVLLPYLGGPKINTVSPRVFETAAMRTGMVMFPGTYSGVVKPWEHYIPLEKDFSNLEEVADRIRDDQFLEELATRAYGDLIDSGRYSYSNFVAEFDEVAAERAAGPRRRGRFPALRLAVEQTATGRSYRVSVAYNVARKTLLVYLGLKHSLRRPALRHLVVIAWRRRHAADAGATTLWDDLFRLALLTSVHDGTLVPESESFRVVPSIEDGTLTFTSTPADGGFEGSVPRGARSALRAGRVDQIVWNHAAVGQYVTMSLPLVKKRISFDVGRYDAYGVYRFDQLLGIAREDPDLALAALEPLLSPHTKSEAT
jgi:hypothetical protein